VFSGKVKRPLDHLTGRAWLVWVRVASRGFGTVDVGHGHARKPCLAFVAVLAPGAVHAGLRVMSVVGDAFDGGFQQSCDALLAVGVGWRGLNPDNLWRLGFHQEDQVEGRRGFTDGFQ
jgi:hypothetical protein